jgi:hypothetical protein
MRQDRRLTGWAALAAAMVVMATLVVIASHRDKGWSEAGTIVYEFGFVVVLGAVPIVVGRLIPVRPDPNRPPAGWGRRGVGRWRIATMVMIAGGAGMLIGRPLAEHNPPGPVWTSDAAFPLGLVVIGLATWNFVRFGPGKLVAIGLLAAGALQFTVYDVGAGPPVWDRGYTGIELVGIWLFCISAVVVLLGAFTALLAERPVTSPSNRAGIVVDESQAPPDGWWIASNGRWFPPELHPDAAPPSGANLARLPRWRHRGILVAGAVVALWAVGIVVANVERHQTARANEEDDRDPPQPDEWIIDPDGADDGIPVIHMIKTFPFDELDVDDIGGRLVWAETEMELCDVEIRAADEASVQIGNIYPASHRCDGGTLLGDAIDDFGMPQTACVFVRSRGVDDERCGPLTIDDSFEQAER